MGKKSLQNKTKESGIVEIAVPENLGSFVTPFIVLISAIMVSAALLIAANQISGKLSGTTTNNVAGATTETTTPQPSNNTVDGIAGLLKDVMDENALKSCLTSGKYTETLSSNEQLASSIGIQGTPGFYVNNKLFAGAYSFADMQADVDAALSGKFVSPTDSTVTMDQIRQAFNSATVKFGSADAKLVFIEVSDPSCPYCHFAAGKNPELSAQVSQFVTVENGGSYLAPVQEIKKLVDEGKAALAFIYSNGHNNGKIATEALFCAHENGKYWQAHDILMSNQGYITMNGAE